MNKVFSNKQDVSKYCGDILESYDCELYGFLDHDKFVDAVASKFFNYLCSIDWAYDESILEIDNDFFDENFINCFMSEEEKKLFAEYFYDFADGRLDDIQSARPWGCPWLYDHNLVLKGSTIKEKAENYWNSVKDVIIEFLDEEEKSE